MICFYFVEMDGKEVRWEGGSPAGERDGDCDAVKRGTCFSLMEIGTDCNMVV